MNKCKGCKKIILPAWKWCNDCKKKPTKGQITRSKKYHKLYRRKHRKKLNARKREWYKKKKYEASRI